MTALDPLELLAGLVLDTGERWGERAEPWQWDDARAMLGLQTRRHYSLRGRGMSKTSDVAAVALALLLTEAPARSRSHAYAVTADQAAIMADTIGGFVSRSGLGGLVEVSARTVTVRSSGATLAVESSDGASAYGLRPWLSICDELAMWPSTSNHRALWAAITSAVPKVPGSRLIVIGTAGSPGSLGAGVWLQARASEFWRTSIEPGPAPWWTPEDVAATLASLTPSEWRRLILCEWAQGDESLTTPEDVAACIRAGQATLPPRPGLEYVAALDVGTRRDLTALAVGHAERRSAGRVVVIDRVLYWRPAEGEGGRVDLSEVEAATLRLAREYGIARLRFDRMQAEQLTGNLGRSGVTAREYVFSAAGASRLARSLYMALRDRSIELPDDDELRAEANTVRMVETGPGTVRMVNPPGTHDDVLTAVGMVLADLTELPDIGHGSITVPRSAPLARTLTDARPGMSIEWAARAAVGLRSHGASRLTAGLQVPGSANDPRRR